MSKVTPFKIWLYGVRLRTIPPSRKIMARARVRAIRVRVNPNSPNSPKKYGRLD